MISDDEQLASLLQEIETELAWGSAKEWTNKDFQQLSDQITEATSVNLSPTTLKRIWGRITYTSRPSNITLNALSLFAGHESWRTFRVATNAAKTAINNTSSNGPEPAAKTKPLKGTEVIWQEDFISEK